MGTATYVEPTTDRYSHSFRWPELGAGRRIVPMADKSPRKQNKGTKLSIKEKKAKKKAKKLAGQGLNVPTTPGTPGAR